MSDGAETPVARIPFTKDDERTILSMCSAMKVAAAANVVAAVVQAIAGVMSLNFGGFVTVLFQAVFAALLFKAAGHFENVAKTDTDDQRQVAAGVEQLRTVFMIKSILVILGMAMMVFALVIVGLIAAMS